MLENYLQVAVFILKRGRRIKDESDNSLPNLGNFHYETGETSGVGCSDICCFLVTIFHQSSLCSKYNFISLRTL